MISPVIHIPDFLMNAEVKAKVYNNISREHTTFAAPYYQSLKPRKHYHQYHLPNNFSFTAKRFTSKWKCVQERDKAIRKAYDDAMQYVTNGNSKSLSKEGAKLYSDLILETFNSDVLFQLKQICDNNDMMEAYDKLETLVSHCYQSLLAEFEDELVHSGDYNAMYDIQYFMEQAEIEKHVFRINEDGSFNLLDLLVLDNMDYTINNLFSTINEMEQDLNERAATFFNGAERVYNGYCEGI